jgi:hypothetical protein
MSSTQVGNLFVTTIAFDLQGTDGNPNKYEITIPRIKLEPPPFFVGHVIYSEVETKRYDIRSALIYQEEKIRMMATDNLNTDTTEYDLEFSAGTRFTGRITFAYNI